MLRIAELQKTTEDFGQLAVSQRQRREKDVAQALRWLEAMPTAEEVRELLAHLVTVQSMWEGALPAEDGPVTARHRVTTEEPPTGTVLIGVDGSQIFPDRHAALLYYLIQVGALVFRYDGSTPTPYADASLHYHERELYDERGYLISATRVGMFRLVRELGFLAQLSQDTASAPRTFALSDGPLLWPYGERGKAERVAFQSYLAAFSRLRELGTVPVGYVDRPGGRYVVEMLWAMQAAQNHPEPPPNPLHLLRDAELMARFLAPGERSIWFRRHSAGNQAHAEHGHPIWFCYLNVGPTIARIEVPAWAVHPATDEVLHAALLHQAKPLNGYPYVLARAHEEALVTTQDKAALDNMLLGGLLSKGLVARSSEKARQKAYLGAKK